jgi:hypothetical protein
MNESPNNGAGGSESRRARGDGDRTCLAMAAAGGEAGESGVRVARDGSEAEWSGMGGGRAAASGWRSGAIGTRE